jgi:hypothetical protein
MVLDLFPALIFRHPKYSVSLTVRLNQTWIGSITILVAG